MYWERRNPDEERSIIQIERPDELGRFAAVQFEHCKIKKHE